MRHFIEELVSEIMQIDRFADTEELPFPMQNPTEEDQTEFLDLFLNLMTDHVQGVLEEKFNRNALISIIAERARQDAKWGQENHEPQYWMGILGEEFGELCQAVNETVFNNGPTEREKGGYANIRTEAVQVAAVAVAFVEMLDRRYGGVK